MEVNPVNTATNAQVQRKDQGGAFSELSTKEFMKILTTQLKHQDPINPMKQSQFIGQLTGLQNLEVLNKLNEVVGKMEQFQQLSAAGNLINKTVQGQTADGQTIQGQVEKVSVEGQSVNLHVNRFRIPVENVIGISG